MVSAAPVTIVDYGTGNLRAIANMIRKVGGQARISTGPADLASASKLILPGVGAFDTGMAQLRERGLLDVLHRKAREEKVPVLGICLGMQLLSRRSEEGALPGLGWIDGEARRFKGDGLRVPHMGWNDVKVERANPLLDAAEPWRFYFVHSYHVVCDRPEDVMGTSPYAGRFTAAVHRDNVLGVQFHPEKSHAFGMKLLKRFLEI